MFVLAAFSPAQNSNDPVTIDRNEGLFTVLAAINNCGYDDGMSAADPVRAAVNAEIGHNLEVSEEAKGAADAICGFYRDHQQPDATRTLSQYISLALYLNPPPAFSPKVKEADMPPDAGGVLGLSPLLGRFYTAAGIHDIWEKHAAAYEELIGRYHDPFAKMIHDTEFYLRLPSGSYLGRTFTIYVEPMGAPAEINARNYGTDYYVVVSPGTNAALKMEQIRHAYLHYLLDPVVGKYAGNMKTLDPLLDTVKLAPMDESFKSDVSLLVTECVIRAIEARTMQEGKASLDRQSRAVSDSMAQGFVLTRYFYERLLDFEKDNIGFRNAVPGMLAEIDVRKEQRQASQVQFASEANPELLQLPRPKEGKLLATARERLTSGDSDAAERLAKQALTEKNEDPGEALYILALVSLRRQCPANDAQASCGQQRMDGARNYFEQALKATGAPQVVAWSHIYLGRILDLQDEDENGPMRAEAIQHYKAAMNASSSLPDAKAAAESGIAKAYAPPQSAGANNSQTDDDK